jgi:hypothetical protein
LCLQASPSYVELRASCSRAPICLRRVLAAIKLINILHIHRQPMNFTDSFNRNCWTMIYLSDSGQNDRKACCFLRDQADVESRKVGLPMHVTCIFTHCRSTSRVQPKSRFLVSPDPCDLWLRYELARFLVLYFSCSRIRPYPPCIFPRCLVKHSLLRYLVLTTT